MYIKCLYPLCNPHITLQIKVLHFYLQIYYNKLFSSAICEPCEETQVHHPVYFNQIDGALIRSTVLCMDGATGPSGMDTAG